MSGTGICDRCKWCVARGCNDHEDQTGPYVAPPRLPASVPTDENVIFPSASRELREDAHITEARQAERERLRGLVEGLPDGYVNRAAVLALLDKEAGQ